MLVASNAGSPPGRRIKVLVVDDDIFFREGVRLFLKAAGDVDVVGAAENGCAAVTRERELRPDVILMGLRMPEMDGVQATRAILKRHGGARVALMTSTEAGDGKVLAAIRAGASGYVPKTATPQELLEAIRTVDRGEPSLPPSITGQLFGQPPPEPLTRREIEILRLVARGLSNLRIAERIHLSSTTVATHVHHILGKLGLANRVEAALYALRHGWTSLDETDDGAAH